MVGLAVAVGTIYFLSAQLSLALLTKPGGVAVFWPAAGVAAGVLIVLGPRARLAVAIGAMAATIVANLLGDRNFGSAILFALCNAGEALLIAWLVERYLGPAISLGRLRNVLGLVIAAFIGTAVAAIGGTVGIKLFHSATTPALTIWQHWVASDALGIVAVAPLVIELAAALRQRPPRRELIEGVLAVAALTLMSGLAILLPSELVATVVPIALLFPPLLWLAARCRPVFAAAAACLVSLLVVWTITFGAGYFGNPDLPIGERVLAAQASILLVSLGSLVLASLFAEIRDKNHELEIASQHKSQFLANMSHELRTPLNAIIGYSEILQEDVKALGREPLRLDLKKIENAGRHLLGLINDILDLSKIEAGHMEVLLEDFELSPLLEEVRAIITPLAEQNGNTLDFRLPTNLGEIRTDRTKLKQCLLNVLSNGNKFTENGRISLVVERLEGDRMVRFAISDTGIGMDDEQLGRLFQAFSQAHASTSKKFGGTGLGLFITQHFCRLLGGDIKATSRPGAGSTFTITLPDKASVRDYSEEIGAPGVSGDASSAITVLVVDNDPAAHDLIAAKLKGDGYRLAHADNGEDALVLARKIQPDAITLDVLNGWAVLSALKADRELCDIPVVMMTVVSDRGFGLSLGAVDLLIKPVDSTRLTTLLRRLVRRDGPVLVVEDDADTRTMVRSIVERMRLMVAEAENGRSALRWLADNQPPAVILLDLMMPEMNGFEFLDALKQRTDLRDTPVIVMTGMQLTTAERDRLLGQVKRIIAKGASATGDIVAAVSSPHPPRLRSGLRHRWAAGRRDGAQRAAGHRPHGHEPSGHRRMGGDPPRQIRRRDARCAGDRAVRSRDERRSREGARSRVRRLRYKAGRV
jgi:signal transduction histidine kinase/CheY-like chemotaxis protein